MPSDDSTRNLTPPSSVPGVVDVHWFDGDRCDPQAVPDLVVEVPHGADRRSHYEALRAQLTGTYPEDLHAFFHVNTDVGAWQVGSEAARAFVHAHPTRRAVALRCLVPRTFIDCNRVAQSEANGSLSSNGLTAAMPPYVRDAHDQALLAELHQRYVTIAASAYRWVCNAGGFALNPHTYGPKTLAIDAVTDTIVDDLRRAHEPETYADSPTRSAVDLIMRTDASDYLGPPGSEEALSDAFSDLGWSTTICETYALHPVTQGYRFASLHRGRVLGLELRRDLLVEEWTPFHEQVIDQNAVRLAAAPLARVIGDLVSASAR